MVRADWLDAARGLPARSVDMLYADPPFNTGTAKRSRAGVFSDRFGSNAAYIAWLGDRLEATLPALAPAANILVHVDWRTSHRVRVMLDDLLGEDRFVNHLVWSYGLGGSSPRRFARKHDDILFYSLDPRRNWFEPPRVPATSNRLKGQTKKSTDVIDVPSLNNMAGERLGYPTQKPLALLELLVGACCSPGGAVFDPCCGSGTTLEAAKRLGRRAFGSDISAVAVRLTLKRLGLSRPARTLESS